jgi:hypothetical protein
MITQLGWVARLWLILPVLALVACSPPTFVNLYNNSSLDWQIMSRDGPVPWPRGIAVRLDRARLPFVSREKYGSHTWTLTIASENHRRIYALITDPELPDDYVAVAERFGGVDVYLQLEPNGLLHAVKPAQQWPAELPKRQPDGYPRTYYSARPTQPRP